MNKHLFLSTVGVFVLGAATLTEFQHPEMPPGMTHEEHMARMKKDADLKSRGAGAMGFDQDTTSHHFHLYPDGGDIQVDVKDPADVRGRGQIRAHLKQIRDEFSRGLFARPFATHAELPDGAETMQRLKSRIRYAYQESDTGGRVRITTKDSEALAAIHEFLRYQIREHATGDDPQVRRRPY
jgi:hypothetical protein